MDDNLREQINKFIREDEHMIKLANNDFMMISVIGVVVSSWEEYKRKNGI